MMPTVSAPSTTGGTSSQSSSATTGTATTSVNKDMFMQLLIAQLKNQDPLNPTDGTAFVTQLAQFQQLEESVNSGQDISAIHSDLDQIVRDLASVTVSRS